MSNNNQIKFIMKNVYTLRPRRFSIYKEGTKYKKSCKYNLRETNVINYSNNKKENLNLKLGYYIAKLLL